MHTETPEKEVVKLSSLADNINSEFRSANTLAREAENSGVSAVKSAIRAGAYLTKARGICKGGFEKWLLDNCPEIKLRTAQRWMSLAKASHVTGLKDAKTLRQAYLAVGIIKESPKELKPLGTAPVDIFEQLYARFDHGLGPVIDITEDMEPGDMPQAVRQKLLARAEPVVSFVEKLKALETTKGVED